MRFQNESLPKDAVKVGVTPSMTEETVLEGILNKHMSPKGKYGYLVVEEGKLDYVWEDTPDDIITADVDHPIVIEPERYHHVIITGPVKFRVEFYRVPTEMKVAGNENVPRPGEAFIKQGC